tara:strand:+ start:439 stop:2223 length:1785 start_codon:yes stop_codon:yes gene_type:complete
MVSGHAVINSFKMMSLKNLSFAILSILFLIIPHINIKNFGGPIATPTDYFIWLGITFFVLIAGISSVRKFTFIKPQLLIYILIFICLGLLSVLFNPILNYHAFLFRTLGLISGVIFFIALHQFKLLPVERDKLLVIIFISGVIEAGIGILQYLDPNLNLPLIAPVYKRIIDGSFQQPNLFSSFIGTTIIMSLFLISRSLFRNLSIGYKLGFYLFVGTLFFVLLASQSRVGFLGTIFGTTVLFISRLRIYKTLIKYSLFWLCAAVVGMGSSYAIEKINFKSKPLLVKKFQAPVTAKSGEGRILIYRTSYEMFKEKPLFGQGPGNFGSQYLFYRKEFLKKNPDYLNYFVEPKYNSHPHNEILYRLTESGIVGGVGLMVLIFSFASMIFRLGRERGGLYLALLLPIGIETQTEFPLYQSIVHWTLFLFLCYLPSSHFIQKIHFSNNYRWRTVLVIFIAGLFLLAGSFLFTTFRAHMDLIKYYKFLALKGENHPQFLKSALDNSYLEQLATRLFMDVNLGIAFKKNNLIALNKFIEWSREERKVFPHMALYLGETRALYTLGKKKQAYDLLEEGLSLYPRQRHLLKQKDVLFKDPSKN